MKARVVLAAIAWTLVAVMAFVIVAMLGAILTGTDPDRVTPWVLTLTPLGLVAIFASTASDHLGRRHAEHEEPTR